MAHKIPTDLKYTKDHEWIKIEKETATIGITDFAQSALGDIVFVELPEIGKTLSAHQAFGVVESIKSVSDLFSPVSGKVFEINSGLQETPELCNAEPYASAWMIKIKLSNLEEINALLSASEYENFLSTL
jgi:glycine cleavage system H protein